MVAKNKLDDKACFAEAIAASRLRCKERLINCVKSVPDVVNQQDAEGRTCLHFAAEHCEGLEELLLLKDVAIDFEVKDKNEETILHFAAAAGCPMAAYALTKACPKLCLETNKDDKSPPDVAKEKNYLEVLNAMLLACCSEDANPSDQCPEALLAIQSLLDAGAVPDTWAPNGNSALMMAASADSPKAIALLLQKSAQINMKDTLGRTALMFAAGNNAKEAMLALMDAGGQQALSLQDNRGNNVLKYALDDSEVKSLLERRFAELEETANKNQAALLASLEAEEQCAAAAKTRRSHRGKKKKRGSKLVPGLANGGILPTLLERGDLSPAASGSELVDSMPEHSTDANAAAIQLPNSTAAVLAEPTENGHNQPEGLGDTTAVSSLQDKAGELQNTPDPGIFRIVADATSPIDETACVLDSSQDAAGCFNADHGSGSNPGPIPAARGSHQREAPGSQGGASSGKAFGNSSAQMPHQTCSTSEATNPAHASEDAQLIDARQSSGGTTCSHDNEESWQEVKKASKPSFGKPPLGRRGNDRQFESSCPLFPSSSSASLESLGDSNLSVASARSTPPFTRQPMLQSGHQVSKNLPVPPPPPPGRRSTPQALTPGLQSSSAPKSCNANAALSWASIVQGSITNSISAPDLALMEEPNHTEETKGGSATASWAPSGAPAQCSEISAEILMTQQTACAASAQTGSDGLPSPPSNESATQSGASQHAEMDCECARLQKLLAQSNQRCLQLQTALMSVQQEHRILLQKAVEDTAHNILQQEQQRYGQQIEALKVLVFQSHHQLFNSRKPQVNGHASGLLQSQQQQKGPQLQALAHGAAFQSQVVPARQRSHLLDHHTKAGHNGKPSAAVAGSPFNRAQSIQPLSSASSGSVKDIRPDSLQSGLAKAASWQPEKGPALDIIPKHHSAQPLEQRGLASKIPDLSPAQAPANVACKPFQASGAAACNPWADSAVEPASEEALGPRHLLPGVDSIWGPTPARHPKQSPEEASASNGAEAKSSFLW